ncbi:MAG: PEGA domain-containing protein, partial [Gallionella sp.]|nr:PEGA domain-containing protein [Gallionella sp.]
SNKTIMSSVFFLDIVEYSKESVVGQISLKDRFNEMLADALKNVPDADRIILDTGDGAAVSFIGDIEEALHAAFCLRQGLIAQDVSIEPLLRVRMGINLGPVRLVRDINGQPNIVGDGINVAQRIMAFADINQILLSRSYYDAVSRLSPQYAGMFRYKGSHTDKHVREHEVYAICVPGEETVQTAALPAEPPVSAESVEEAVTDQSASKGNKLPIFIGIAVVIAAIAGWVISTSSPTPPPPPITNNTAASNVAARPIATSSVVATKPTVSAIAAIPNSGVASATKAKKSTTTSTHRAPTDEPTSAPTLSGEGRIVISCKPGAQVFIDGASKGKTGSDPLIVSLSAGSHSVIVNTGSGVVNQKIELESGKTIRINPGACN